MSKLYVDEIRPKTAGNQVLMPEKPAFHVKPSSDQSNIATSSYVDVVFGTVVLDNGNNFANNKFTAPVAGTYLFGCNLRMNSIDTAANYYGLALSKNGGDGSFWLDLFDPGGNSTDLSVRFMHGVLILELAANDTIGVQVRQEVGTAQSDVKGDSRFFGHLVG